MRRVVNSHLSTKFLKNGLGVTIFDHFFRCLDESGLSIKIIITLGRDIPYVNKTVASLLNEKLKLMGHKPLLDFGSCYLHIVNNGFKKGLDILAVNVAEFITSLKKFFDKSDVRLPEFKDIQTKLDLNNHKFLEHCETRWLTLCPGCERGSEKLPAIREYFLVFLPKKNPKILRNYYYKIIVGFLENPFL